MNDLKDYRIILTIWLALGIGVTGYFKIYPDIKTTKKRLKWRLDGETQYDIRTTTNFVKYELSLLTTIVGAVLIGGIGFFTSKKK